MIRVKLMGAVLAALLLGLGWLWLRDSPVFAVQSVRIVGVGGASAALIEDSLQSSAKTMTTTDFDVAKLRASVRQFAQVAGVAAVTSVPHGVRIEVSERHPVAALLLSGRRLAVSADGVILAMVSPASTLPTVAPSTIPSASRLRDPFSLGALRLLGAAPAVLRDHVVSVTEASKGLQAQLRGGPLLYFGDASLPHAKWDAVAAVLADPGSQGAAYIDVRLPERPVAQVDDLATSASSVGLATGSAPGTSAANGVVQSQTVTLPSTGG